MAGLSKTPGFSYLELLAKGPGAGYAGLSVEEHDCMGTKRFAESWFLLAGQRAHPISMWSLLLTVSITAPMQACPGAVTAKPYCAEMERKRA